MQTFTYSELSEEAQQNAINLYYADPDYQGFISEKAKELPEEVMMVSDWASECGIKFNKDGERVL